MKEVHFVVVESDFIHIYGESSHLEDATLSVNVRHSEHDDCSAEMMN